MLTALQDGSNPHSPMAPVHASMLPSPSTTSETLTSTYLAALVVLGPSSRCIGWPVNVSLSTAWSWSFPPRGRSGQL